jgi:hypothetical protein
LFTPKIAFRNKVTLDGWRDGWMEGWMGMDEWMDGSGYYHYYYY